MKVLHLINTLCAGGAECLVGALAVELTKHCEVGVWVSGGVRDAKGQELLNRLRGAGIEVGWPNLGRRWQRGFIPPLMLRHIIAQRPDIIHAHLEQTEIFAAACRFCWPRPILIRTIHNSRLCLPLARRLRSWLNSSYDWTIACSDAVLKAPELALPPGRSSVIDNGVAMFAEPTSADRERAKSHFAIQPGRIVLAQIGSMRGGQKAHDVVLDAFAAGGFASRCELVFIGDGSERKRLEARCKDLGVSTATHFLGIVPDVLPYICASDLVLMPSRFEGLPLTAIEAACCGVPMVVSDIDSLQPFVSGGSSVCAAGSVESLVGAIGRSLNHLDTMRQEAERLACSYRKQFDISAVAERYFHLYCEVASGIDPLGAKT